MNRLQYVDKSNETQLILTENSDCSLELKKTVSNLQLVPSSCAESNETENYSNPFVAISNSFELQKKKIVDLENRLKEEIAERSQLFDENNKAHILLVQKKNEVSESQRKIGEYERTVRRLENDYHRSQERQQETAALLRNAQEEIQTIKQAWRNDKLRFAEELDNTNKFMRNHAKLSNLDLPEPSKIISEWSEQTDTKQDIISPSKEKAENTKATKSLTHDYENTTDMKCESYGDTEIPLLSREWQEVLISTIEKCERCSAIINEMNR